MDARTEQAGAQRHTPARPLPCQKGSTNASISSAGSYARYWTAGFGGPGAELASNSRKASRHVAKTRSQHGWVSIGICVGGRSTGPCPEARDVLRLASFRSGDKNRLGNRCLGSEGRQGS